MIRVTWRDHAPFGAGLLPLLAGWATALATMRDVPVRGVAVVGAVATGAAVSLGLPVWVWSLRRAPGRLLSATLVLLTAAGWVWLQYALNPLRYRPIGEAMLASHALTYQVMAGLWLFGSLVILARGTRAAAPPQPEPGAGPAVPLERIGIRVSDRTVVVTATEVERLQAADDYVAVFAGGRRLLATYRLTDLAARLDPRWFVRVHRSHVVNLRYVESVDRVGTGRAKVRLRSGAVVPASRAGTAALRCALDRA